MKKLLLLLTFSIFLAGCVTQPTEIDLVEVDETSVKMEQSGVADTGDKPASRKVVKICKSYAPTGSRVGKKVCRTKEAWELIEQQAQDALDKGTRPQSNNQT